MPDEERRALAGMGEDLLDRDREILADVLVDAARCLRTEVARATVAAEVEVEDVVAGAREVVRDAPGREMPGVAVLTEAVDEQNRSAGAAVVRDEPLSDHRKRNAASAHHQLLHERRTLVTIDGLFEGAAVEDQAVSGGGRGRELARGPWKGA
jgi:hypothetical protein